jgi:bacillithiol system protein YtxJ
MSKTPFAPLETVNDFDRLLERSHEAPAVLFLHDQWCPISANAYREMTALEQGAIEKTVLIDVTRAKDLTRAIEERTGVRHESPQVLVLRDGKAAWNASHFAITARAVSGAVAESA